jgi:inorganic triphosphatase YgiF
MPAEVELSFDDGEAVADGRALPISEVELELVRGDASALYDLALAMRGVAPLRIEPLDKATRGWLLATDAAPPAAKAVPIRLERGQTVDEALALTLGATLRHWLDNEPAAADGREPEGLHQLRVALRRLRSALAIFADAVGRETWRRWGDELRWLLGPLGPARDLDVLTAGLLPPLLEARGGGDPALAAFREVAQERRAAAQAGVRETLASQRYADLALNLAAWIERRGWRGEADAGARARQEEEVGAFAGAVLRRRHRQVRKRGKGFATLDPEARHELRIALKKLRYGTDFFAGLFPEAKRAARFRKAMARIQDRLGHLNDVAVASRLVHELVDPLPPDDGHARTAALGGGELVGWYAHQVAALEPETVAAWEAFEGLEPFWTGVR